MVDLVGLHEVARQRAGKFSLGMGQRLGIAAALLGDPATLILDEPVNGLDPEGVHWIRTLLRGLAAEGRTVFVSSHLMSEMALTADHLIVIGRGRLIADTPSTSSSAVPQAARPRPLAPGGRAARAARCGTASRSSPAGRDRDRRHRRRTRRRARGREQHRAARVDAAQASLEEAFMELTRGDVEFKSVAA